MGCGRTGGGIEREDGRGAEAGFKGSPDTLGSCIKLKLANQTRYRCNLIVILIKIATDEDPLKCELRLKRAPGFDLWDGQRKYSCQVASLIFMDIGWLL